MIHFPVVHMTVFGILKAASKSQIAAILPEPLNASICKLGRVWEMSSTVAQRGTVTPVLTHTYTDTHFTSGGHCFFFFFFPDSYESHWLLEQDNCVNLLQNCLCLHSWITGAWLFFFFFGFFSVVADKLQALCSPRLWNGWMCRATSFPIRHSRWSALQAYIDELILDVFSPASAGQGSIFIIHIC